MNLRKPLLITLSCISFLLLSACASSTPGPDQDPLKQRCKNLSQDLASSNYSSFDNPVGNNPAQEARVRKSYQQYNCPAILGEAQ